MTKRLTKNCPATTYGTCSWKKEMF